MLRSLTLLTLTLAPLAAAHCKITSASGSAGGSSTGLGITAGSGNSESDVTIFRGDTGFGHSTSSGNINPTSAVPAALKLANSNTPPQVASGGSVSMTMHVVNADGAGPMKCYVSQDATGQDWSEMQVSQNVPGFNGLNLVNDQDYPMVAEMPQGANCTGQIAGMSSMCMVKCQNPIGPFGSSVPVQMVSGQAQKRQITGANFGEDVGNFEEDLEAVGNVIGSLKKRQITGANPGEEIGNFEEDLEAAANVIQTAGRPAAVRSILKA